MCRACVEIEAVLKHPEGALWLVGPAALDKMHRALDELKWQHRQISKSDERTSAPDTNSGQ